jgi:hypothetical protein
MAQALRVSMMMMMMVKLLCRLHRLYTPYDGVIMNQVLVVAWNDVGTEYL